VAAAKIHFEEQKLVTGTNQSRQADKAAGPACFVPYRLVMSTLPSGFLPIYLHNSTFLRYLWKQPKRETCVLFVEHIVRDNVI